MDPSMGSMVDDMGCSDDDEQPTSNRPNPKKRKGKSTRWKIPATALQMLEQVFTVDKFPSVETRKQLALNLKVTPRQVQVWFQNKRQRRAGKAKREQEAANGLTSSGVQDSHYPTQTSPLPSVPETVSTAALFDLPTLAPGAAPPPASAPTDPQQNHQQPSLSVYVPPSPEGAVAAQSSGAHATTGGAPPSAAGCCSAPSPSITWPLVPPASLLPALGVALVGLLLLGAVLVARGVVPRGPRANHHHVGAGCELWADGVRVSVVVWLRVVP